MDFIACGSPAREHNPGLINQIHSHALLELGRVVVETAPNVSVRQAVALAAQNLGGTNRRKADAEAELNGVRPQLFAVKAASSACIISVMICSKVISGCQ